MMDHLFTAGLVALSASFIQSVVGFGAGLISMALLSMIWPVHFATLVMAPLGLLMTSTLTWRLRAQVKLRALIPLLAGLPFGVALGILGYERLPVGYLRGGLGALLICSALYHGLSHRWGRAAPRGLGPALGVLSGVTGVSLNSPGPPAIIYATLMGWSPRDFRANLSLFFLLSGCCAVLTLSLRGHLRLESLKVSASLAPALLLGVWLGSAVAEHIPTDLFRRLTLLLLVGLGLLLLR